MKIYSLEELQQLESSTELHEFMLHYNWDDGVEVPRVVINNKNCDSGTALMVYWFAGPGNFYQYETPNEASRNYEIALYDLIQEIEQKYLGGFYQSNRILFNPRYDNHQGGYDHTQTYDDFPQKRKIPDEMMEPNIPDLKWEAMGKPIKAVQKINYE